jgi:uncharacterized phage-associated protein
MISALVVANKIIELCNNKQIEVNHLKLQKLLYFVQDAYFKKYGELLFDTPMHAWNYGPVEIGLYKLFSLYKDHPIPTDNVYQISTDALNDKQIEIIKNIVDESAKKDPWELVKKTQKPGDRWDFAKNTKGLGCIISFI